MEKKVVFGFSRGAAFGCCGTDTGDFSLEITSDAVLTFKTYLFGESGENETYKREVQLPESVVTDIREITSKYSTIIKHLNKNLYNGSDDGTWYGFVFEGKKISALNIEYKDDEQIAKESPEYYQEYKENIRQENEVIRLFYLIAVCLTQYGIDLRLHGVPILSKEGGTMIHSILFPSDYFNKTIADEELKAEYDIVRYGGVYDSVILFSYEDWFHNGKLKLDWVPNEPIDVVYRGWMMLPEQYEMFYIALKNNNINLVTTPEEYALFHIFPNIYEKVKEDTPKMLIYPQGTQVDLTEVKREFKRFMVKDYVKSVKGTDFPKYFDETITQEEFDSWMEKFYQYRGGLFTGGICIKEYVDLKKYGEHKNEYRVFYGNGEIITVSRNSGQPEYAPKPPKALIEKYLGLDSKFYTIDYAELENGEWIVIEAGDGGVSGLSDFQDYQEFYRKLYYCFL